MDPRIVPIGGALAIVALTVWYFKKKKAFRTRDELDQAKSKPIPGPPLPANKKEGHLGLLASCGSLHEFLSYLHSRYGPIVSFFLGEERVVSTACPALFKEQAKIFDRPPSLFDMFRPLFGDASMQYCNGDEGKFRHSAYSKAYTDDAVKPFYHMLQKIADEMMDSYKAEDIFSARENSLKFALRSMLRVSFGLYFDDDKEATRICSAYDVCMKDMEQRIDGSFPEVGSERERVFNQNRDTMINIMKAVVDHRRKNPPEDGEHLFVDTLLGEGFPDDVIACDMVGVFIAGFHTTGLLLAWGHYFISKHQDVQEKLHEELVRALGDKPPTADNVHKLVYMRQVIDETLRVSTLAPYAARFRFHDAQLGGFDLPAGTPVVHALGVMNEDESLYPDHERFDPERFSPAEVKKRPSFSFVPFGFAGKRKCFGYRLSYVETYVFFAKFYKKFRTELIPDHPEISHEYGFVTNPSEEIKLRLIPRS